MHELSAFRGASGEVVRGFVRPATLLTCLPVVVGTFALGAFAAMIVAWTGMPSWLVPAACFATTAPVVGLFAMSARTGAFSAGFFEALTQHAAGVPGFALRFCAVSLPPAAVAGLAAERLSGVATSLGSPTAPIAGLPWLGLFLLAGVAAPSLGLLVAARTESIGEALSPRAWAWLASERRGDLPAYFSSVIGGLALFWMLALPLAAVGAVAVASLEPRLGAALTGAAWLAPLAASPILLGRLAGAFAAGDYLDQTDLTPQRAATSGAASSPPAAPASAVAPTPSSPAGATAPGASPAVAASAAAEAPSAAVGAAGGAVAAGCAGAAIEPRTPVNVAVQRIEERAAEDPGGALRDAEALAEREPRSAAAQALLARLAHGLGLALEAREAAGRAIPLALEMGAVAVAVDLFLQVSTQARKLELEGPVWLQLGKALAARSEDAAAHWCLRAAGAAGADETAVDKARIQLAEAALEGERAEAALRIYEAFLAERGDSPFADFAREGAELARRRLPVGVG